MQQKVQKPQLKLDLPLPESSYQLKSVTPDIQYHKRATSRTVKKQSNVTPKFGEMNKYMEKATDEQLLLSQRFIQSEMKKRQMYQDNEPIIEDLDSY